MNPYENLCYNDPRNPMFSDLGDDAPEPRKGCFCDNCFYGRDAMALEIIALRAERDRQMEGKDRLNRIIAAALDDDWENPELVAYRVIRSGWKP